MKKTLLAWGFLALGVVTPHAWAQTQSSSGDWRPAGILERPESTEATTATTADVRDPFGLPAPRVQRVSADLGAPRANDANGKRLPDVEQTSNSTPAPNVDFGCHCSHRGFFVGAGIYFAQPVFSSNPAFVATTNQTITNPNTTSTHTKEFDWSFQATPKVWLGYVGDHGWGVQFSLWHFQADPATLNVVHPADPPGIQTFGSTLGALPIPVRSNFPPIPADFIQVDSTLQLDTYDLEGIWVGNNDFGYVKAGVGARYAYLRQTYSASLSNTGNPPTFFQHESNTFSGGGPTISGEMGCRVWRRFGLYGTGRFSLLFGQSTQEAEQLQTGINPSLGFASNSDRMVAIPVGEIELGVSWQTDWNRCRFIVKSGFAAQMWWDAGSASIPSGGSFSSLGAQSPQGVFFPVTTATSSNLGFFGWTFSMGFNY
jgi:hypothetical protein